MVCSYAPYVLLSIFAGAISDRWNKKVTMLVSDSFAAFCTVIVLLLLVTDNLSPLWQLNGLTVCGFPYLEREKAQELPCCFS